jgi:hypothetical protein
MRLGFCLILILGFAQAAAAAECPAPDAPEIRVEVAAAPVREDRSLSFLQLSGIPSASRRAGLEAYDGTLALTDAEFGPRAEIDLHTVAAGDGYCTMARSALITLSWETVIYVAAQIPPGSCIDRTVREHEAKHVAIDRRLVPIAEQAAEIALRAVIRRGVYGSTVEGSRRNLQDRVRATINEAMSIFAAVRKRKQLALDTKEEYDKVRQRCGIAEYLQVIRAGIGT